MDYEYTIYDLADMLADEIEESGKSRWSAKDVKDFFLSEGIDLSLDEIIQVWNACSSPVCACELLGCDEAIMADKDIVGDNEIVNVFLDEGLNDTFFMEAQTQYEVITIKANTYAFGRYDASYLLQIEDEDAELASGSLRYVIHEFFNRYDVSDTMRASIKRFASNY